MGTINWPPDILRTLTTMRARISALENASRPQIYTTATRPAGVGQGTVIFVKDAAAGSKFQGWDGSGWVSLG